MKRYRAIFIIVGLVILALLFYGFGVRRTIEEIVAMGWRFWIIVAIFFFNNVFMTYAWRVLITHPVGASYFPRLLMARIAGDSTSSINAVASAAGEALKAIYIRDHIPFKVGLASVILDRIAHIISNILMVLTGIFVGFFVLSIPYAASITVFALFTLMLAIIIRVLRKHEEGFLQYLLSCLPRGLLSRIMTDARREKIGKLDGEISLIFSSRENLRNFYISLAVHYASGFIATSLEIYFIIIFSGNAITFVHAMFVNLFGLFLTSIVFFMPANLGTSEGSYSLALRFLGYDPAIGLTVGIVRRLRTFVWAGIGILILFHAGLVGRKGGSKTEA